MRRALSCAALVVASSLAVIPSVAQAQHASVPDRIGDTSPAVDISQVRTRNAGGRVTTVTLVPGLRAGRLSGIEMIVRAPVKKKVYSVTVLRDRGGRVVDTTLSWRPLNDPVEPRVLRCSDITTSIKRRGISRVRISVPVSCLTKTDPAAPVRTKIRVVDGTSDLDGAYWSDQSRFSPPVAPGRAQPAEPTGRATARGGLVVRALPTPFSARKAKIPRGDTFPISCAVTGSVVFRGDPDDGVNSNLWYRLPASSTWVSALFVRSIGGDVPYCGDGTIYRGRATHAFRPREAPTKKANAHGGLTQGTKVKIMCKLEGQAVRGNDLWYNLPQGLWVPARYVDNVGSAPAYCTS